MMDNDIYAVGEQDFKNLREMDALYIDKTRYVEMIVRSKSKYYFLARPRRFGKSLFLSTLRYFFEGRRDLFRGLFIDSADWDWQPYPVLYLDLNSDRFAEPGMLEPLLDKHFKKWEEEYGVTDIPSTFSQRFSAIIEAAHEKTGKQVVVLVDEYDKPLSLNINKDDNYEHYRARLASIYSNFKSSAEHLRLVFLTGISRFGKLSVFSDLNNLNDISFDDAFADICGITEMELHENFKDGIERLAAKRRTGYNEAVELLKKNYDGYRFAPEGNDIYNPWSLLCCMQKGRIGMYWNTVGPPSLVARVLSNTRVDLEKTLNARWRLDRLAGLDLRNANPTALLYQTGYLTMADYNVRNDTVRLKVPNNEVKDGLFNDLLKLYLREDHISAESVVEQLVHAIDDGKPEEMMRCLDAYFAGVPYDLKMDNENNFHNAFYILTTLIGIDARAEAHTSDGRIDLLIETPEYIYIIELKYDGSPAEALRQIEEKGYARRFAGDARKIFLIGVNFSSVTRRIEGWEIA
ncbi:MAG: ATP-binding protein [Bacteroidales bacterium]|nr:ATP-binding protein [Bacteroidales bacterium]